MVLTRRCEYALRALIDIGLAQAFGHERVPTRALAQVEGISELFLSQILLQLQEAGIVEGKRGQRGGYSIAAPLESITPGKIVRLIDGPIAPIRCVSVTAYERCSCPDEDHCGLRLLMIDVRNSMSRILDQHTLKDVVAITLKHMKRDGVRFALLDALAQETRR
jgi:Rrf2 family protein